MTLTNQKVVLNNRPKGLPEISDFLLVEAAVEQPTAGEVLVKVEHLGIDAFIATTLNHDGYHGQSGLREPVMAIGTGEVIASQSPDLAVGDKVIGGMGAQTYRLANADQFQKIDTSIVPAKTYLGLLGLTTGMTAYAGMHFVAGVKADDVVVVSAAAGAVGTVACQLAKLAGARVIGIAGGPEKCEFLQTIGCDAALDYKRGEVAQQLADAAPQGIDVFFDNVGGDILDAALGNISIGARVIICGAISQYGDLTSIQGPSLYLQLAERNATMRGFTVDHYPERYGQMQAELAKLVAGGHLQLPEHIEQGVQSFPQALTRLYQGGHVGKLLVAA